MEKAVSYYAYETDIDPVANIANIALKEKPKATKCSDHRKPIFVVHD